MAYVKIHFVQHAKNLVRYVQAERGPNDLVDGEGLIPEKAAERFEQMRHLHDGKGSVQAIHIIQSWSEEDSQKLPKERFEELGKELTKSYFPGHDFLIVTHTETGKTHNHIVVCPWHSETGKKIENKKFHLYNLREKSNELSVANGLSIIRPRALERNVIMPDRVQRMIRFNGRSHLLDLMQKADFARAYATNFDDYVNILQEFKINAVVQNKNITYFYPGKQRGKRGSKLGKVYDKEGLSKAFEINRTRVAANPRLQEHLQHQIATIQKDPAALGRALSNISAPSKTFSKLQGTGSSHARQMDSSPTPKVHQSERELSTALVPINEIHRAKSQSIVEYAQRNRIALTRNPDGSHTLTGRPFVQIHDRKWNNTRNRTQGSLIDFVAAHKSITFLEAIAEINNNPRLLVLQQSLGKQERKFTSFYIPEEKRLSTQKALQEVNSLFKSFDINNSRAASLLETNQFQVPKPGVVRLFSRNDYTTGMEFTQKEDKTWHTQKLGEITSPFYSTSRNRHRALVFTDPFTLMHHGGLERVSRENHDMDLLVLFEMGKKVIDLFLAKNPHIRELEFVPPAGHTGEGQDLFIRHTKEKYQSMGVPIQMRLFDGSRDRGMGLSL